VAIVKLAKRTFSLGIFLLSNLLEMYLKAPEVFASAWDTCA